MRSGLVALLIAACGALVVTTGCASRQGDQPMLGQRTGNYVDDSWLTSVVKARLLGDTGLKSFHIHVKTTGRVVTLSGTLPSEALREEAIRVAKSVDGVTGVVSELKVQPPAD